MKLYIENLKLGYASNINFYTAMEAYYNMGFEIIKIEDNNNFVIEDDNIVLGSIQFMYNALNKLNIKIPEPLDYPESLYPFIGRKIWSSTIAEIVNTPEKWNVFIKPKGLAKKFTGRFVKGTADLIDCGDSSKNIPIWVSEPKEFIAEWRVFVRYGRILGVRMYKGDWRAQYDHKIIESAVIAYKDAPNGYALDFGRTKEGEFLLVEANDGYSLGSYGLFYIDYAKLLSARWAELTGQRDICYF